MQKPLVNRKFLLEKFPGKGGWTYVSLPKILQDKRSSFGWVRVKGTIDGFEIRKYHIMPLGKDKLFLPVKAEIRKKIRKQEGEFVKVVLFADNDPVIIPEELEFCLLDNPVEYETFSGYTNQEQQAVIDWIYAKKADSKRIERISKVLNELANRKKIRPFKL